MSLGFAKGALRVTKNYTKGYSDVQARVREATSNSETPPTGQQLNEISQLSYSQNDFIDIIEILDKRLNDKGKNWRHVYKSLAVIDYLLHSGSENVVLYFRQNIYIIKTLKEFQYIDEVGKDQGANVRLKSKDITNLLADEARLRETRRNRANMRDRMVGKPPGQDENDGEIVNENAERRNRESTLESLSRDREDDPVRRAIRANARAELMKQGRMKEEQDVQKALKLSAADEQNRKNALAASGGMSLFDDMPANSPTSNNGNELISLGDSANASQFLKPQQTILPQFTSYNPYEQQAQQEAMQAEYLRQQMVQQQAEQEWLQQQQMIQQQQQAQQLQQQQQAQQLQQQQWFLQQQQTQQQSLFPAAQQLLPQPTGFGSNNPFARSASPVPPLPTSAFMTNTNSSAFSATSPMQSPTSPISPAYPNTPTSPGYPPFKMANKPENEHLANLFANRADGGLDTFGNFGQLRFGPNQASQLAGRT